MMVYEDYIKNREEPEGGEKAVKEEKAEEKA
jgi:hypothetical protein